VRQHVPRQSIRGPVQLCVGGLPGIRTERHS
jgi:hypothetical protein